MASTGNRPKDQKRLVKRVRRAKAPLAAQFEDCVQASIRLTDALQANRPRFNKLRDLGQECKDRLAFWGENSGATTRTLDYNLKCSPALVHQTQALLDDLNQALTQAAPLVRPLVFEAEPHDLHTEKAAVAAILQDYDLDLDPELWVTEAVDVVDYLVKLLPAYRDHLGEEAPAPTSLDSQDDSGEFSADWYTKEAAGLFPAASRRLQERLGRVNWRRRQYLHQIRARPRTATQTETATVTVQVPSHSELGRTAKPTPAPRSTGKLARPPTVVHVQPPSRQTTRSDFSDTASTTAETQITSIVSRATDPDQNSNYTLTESLQSTSLPTLTLPAPPVDLDSVQDESFECSICHFELPLTVSAPKVTPDDWADHVYSDLKAYICTFDGCNWGNAMYGVKREWFRHEMDHHRSSTVWSCGICRCDFGSESQFSDHLAQHNIGSQKPASVVGSCKRFSPKDRPYLRCQLCHESCHDLGELEAHVANHLEYFALAALQEHSPTTLPDATAPEDYTNIHDYLADLSDDDDGRQVPETKTIRASSPPAAPSNAVPGPPPTEGSRAADPSDASLPDDPDKLVEFPHLRTATAKQVVDQKVSNFLKQTRQAAPIQQEPQTSNVPTRDEKFFGRDVDLERMHSSLSELGRICTVTGRGGMGKTATAIEYLHRYRNEYGFVFWVDAESQGVLQRQYLMIADIMDTGGTSLHDESNRIIFVKECLQQSERRWLLALDNVPTWGDVARYIPKNLSRTQGSILVTIRGTQPLTIPSSAYIQDHIHLDPWSIGHSREFLLTSIAKKLERENLELHEEYELAKSVVQRIDGLPLAVTMVVGYIKVSRCNLQDFLEMWEEKAARRRPRAVRKTGPGIDPIIDSLWEIGIGEVRANCRKLLDVLSFLGSETIPKSLLVGPHEEDYLDFLHHESILRYNRMITQLQRQRLIAIKEENGEPAYSIHRVLQEMIQYDLDVYSFADAFRKAFRLLRNKFPVSNAQQVPVPADLEMCKRYMPHVASFFEGYQRYNEEHDGFISIGDVDPVEVAGLFYDAAFFVWGGASTAYKGTPYLEAADQILEEKKVQGNKKMRADINCIYGLLLLNMGYEQRALAAQRLEQAWDIRRHLYDQQPVINGDEDVLSQNAANDWGICLMNQYRFDEADRLLQGCLERYKLWGTIEENPFEYSKFYGNYTVVLLWEGKFQEAIESCHTCLRLTERFGGGKRSQYYRRLFFLGCIYLQAGDLQKAYDTHVDALTQRIVLQGPYHENTLMSLYAVGAMFHYLGDVTRAIEYMKQCLKRAQNVEWPHEAYGRAQHHLAIIYDERGAEGDKEEAEALREESIKTLNDYISFTPQHIRDTGDEMMMFDDMQGTFTGRYTGRTLLPHIRKRQGKLEA